MLRLPVCEKLLNLLISAICWDSFFLSTIITAYRFQEGPYLIHANFEIRVSLEPYFKGSLYTCKDYDNIVSNRSTSILLDLFEARPYLTTILLFTLERFEKRQYLLLKIWSKRFGNEDGCNDRKIECWFHNQFQYQWLTLLISKNKQL